MSKPIYADESIFIKSPTIIKGFEPINYKININHPVVAKLYKSYCNKIKYPTHMAMSDEQRFEFEGIIIKAILDGKIIVTTAEKNQSETSNSSD